jgi:hypothetical protein
MMNNNKIIHENIKSGLMTRRKVLQLMGGYVISTAIPFPVIARQTGSTLIRNTGSTLIGNTKKRKNIYYTYRSFWPELEMTAKFKEMGINTRCFFASNTINSAGFEYCKYPLIWKGIKKYDFSAYDRQIEDLLSANPEADLMCMIDLNTPSWLTRRFAYDSFSEVSHAASDKNWLDITTEWMKDFISYSEEKYGKKIIAYILSGGGTSEWYEYDRGYSSRIKNAAWRKWCSSHNMSLGEDVPGESSLQIASHENVIYDPQTEMHKIQYWRFHNGVIADAILHYAKEARTLISSDKEIGVFFGYFLVSNNKLVSFGHLDYERVFASPDIDFIISPGTYDDRMIGGGSGSQLVFHTAERYGKRYLHEIDHGTHVAPARIDWKTQDEDNAGLKREAFFSLINHLSLWWFDMWGGWYKETETQELIKHLKSIHDRYVNDESSSVAEVLLIADPQSACYMNEKKPQASSMAYKFRNNLNRTGAPFDLYSFNDIPVIDLSRYKVIFLPATLLITPERETILKNYILKNNRTIVWVYAPGICNGENLDTARVKKWTGVEYGTSGPVKVNMGRWKSVYSFEYGKMTPSVLKDIIKEAGAHLYIEDENPVYANERLVAVHFKDGGVKKIMLPKVCKKVIDVFSGKVVAENTSEFTYSFKTPDTVMFEINQ